MRKQKALPNKKLCGIVFGVMPGFRGKGIEAYVVVKSGKIIQPHLYYTEYEMQWMAEFNPGKVLVS